MNPMFIMGVLLIVTIGTLIAYIGIPLYKSKTKKDQRENINYWVGKAVEAFEQQHKESGQGPLKKEKVLEFIDRLINEKGYSISEGELDILIEAAIHKINKIGKELKEENEVLEDTADLKPRE